VGVENLAREASRRLPHTRFAVAIARDGEVGEIRTAGKPAAASAAACIRDQVQSKVEISTAIATTPSQDGDQNGQYDQHLPAPGELQQSVSWRAPASLPVPRFRCPIWNPFKAKT